MIRTTRCLDATPYGRGFARPSRRVIGTSNVPVLSRPHLFAGD